MRILEAFGEPISYGGQESFVFRTIKNMNRKNLHFDFLTPYYVDNSGYVKFINSINSKLYVFNLPFEIGKSRFNVIKDYKKVLRENHYDVVHIHSGSISILALFTLYAKKMGVKKVIVHSHMAGEEKNIKHEILKKIYSPVFNKYSNVLIAPTFKAAYWQFSKKNFEKKGKILKNGIDVKEYAFSSEKRIEYRNKLGFNSENIVIGHVGRFSPEKNHVFLIDLLEYSLKQNKNVRLLLIGGGNEKKYIQGIISKKGLKEFVKLVDNVDNVSDYLTAMDIFVFPSKYEGLGIASIEAQASALPVLASSSVPKDIKITNNVAFLDLNAPISEWYKKMHQLVIRNKRDGDVSHFIIKEGYDITNTAENLRNIYLR